MVQPDKYEKSAPYRIAKPSLTDFTVRRSLTSPERQICRKFKVTHGNLTPKNLQSWFIKVEFEYFISKFALQTIFNIFFAAELKSIFESKIIFIGDSLQWPDIRSVQNIS